LHEILATPARSSTADHNDAALCWSESMTGRDSVTCEQVSDDGKYTKSVNTTAPCVSVCDFIRQRAAQINNWSK